MGKKFVYSFVEGDLGIGVKVWGVIIGVEGNA
jgi:hypothetical protein